MSPQLSNRLLYGCGLKRDVEQLKWELSAAWRSIVHSRKKQDSPFLLLMFSLLLVTKRSTNNTGISYFPVITNLTVYTQAVLPHS